MRELLFFIRTWEVNIQLLGGLNVLMDLRRYSLRL